MSSLSSLELLQLAFDALKKVELSQSPSAHLIVAEKALLVLLAWAIECEKAAGP